MSREFFESPQFHDRCFVTEENGFCLADSNNVASTQAKEDGQKPGCAKPALTLQNSIDSSVALPSLTLTNPETTSEYRVNSGDTLWGIARKELKAEGVAVPSSREVKWLVQEILERNKDNKTLHSGQLLPGTTLNIPLGDANLTKNKTTSSATAAESASSAGPANSADTTDSSPNAPDYQPKRWSHKPAPHQIGKSAEQEHHHELRLRDIEKGVLKLGKTFVDDMHHWLASVAAKSFSLAEKEAHVNGIHIQISSAGRTYSDQARLYHQLHKRQSVALPGTSNHETGLAIDVINWRQAKPYLLAHGFVHGDGHGALRNDPWHFKYIGV
ncbi:MAG TPA: D-alanyl-D-alanine carboxypeptidase family protein [Oculatellaceae cyanobacterium]